MAYFHHTCDSSRELFPQLPSLTEHSSSNKGFLDEPLVTKLPEREERKLRLLAASKSSVAFAIARPELEKRVGTAPNSGVELSVAKDQPGLEDTPDQRTQTQFASPGIKLSIRRSASMILATFCAN